jgi:hypothetical protein
LAFAIALAAASCDCFGGERRLEYMFADDDPEAVVPVNFPLSEMPLRLDESGHRHGRDFVVDVPGREVHVAMLDNACKEAWFRQEAGATPALRIVGLEATDACDAAGTLDELTRSFREEFVRRLEGAIPPLPYTRDFEGELYEYPAGSAPTLVLAESLEGARALLDAAVAFEHEYHDGVFYLSPIACSGRFRVVDDQSASVVRIEGIGYVKPCTWGDDRACLKHLFALALGELDQVSPMPTQCRLTTND